MSVKDDIERAFEAALEIDSGKLTLGERAPVPCLVPEGVTRFSDGEHRTKHQFTLTARKADIGTIPRMYEAGSLVYDESGYDAKVTEDDVTESAGLLTFTMSG